MFSDTVKLNVITYNMWEARLTATLTRCFQWRPGVRGLSGFLLADQTLHSTHQRTPLINSSSSAPQLDTPGHTRSPGMLWSSRRRRESLYSYIIVCSIITHTHLRYPLVVPGLVPAIPNAAFPFVRPPASVQTHHIRGRRKCTRETTAR